MITPWKQECGNAEYAERLCNALDNFANVTPFDLRNFAEDFELRSASSVRKHFDDMLAKINSQDSDVVHIQHEFCFFGRSIQRSNREFLRFVQSIKKPIVVTLHTWLDRGAYAPKWKMSHILKRPWEFVRSLAQRRHLESALDACEAIVVHTHDTYTLVVSALPKIRSKVHVVQIPIAPVDSNCAVPSIRKKEGDIWLLLPGFVSPYKGHRHAINALQKLPENYKLVIAGGRHPKDRGATRYWMELLTEVESRGLQSQVIFTGFLPTGAEQAAILKQADLFLLPYDEVGQSGSAVLADALAYDRPVVTSRARSMYAYRMSQDTVYCCTSIDVGNADALAATIAKTFADNPVNKEIARQRRAAQARFSPDRIAEAYEQLYMDVRSN